MRAASSARAAAAAVAPASKPISGSAKNTDGVRRCWGEYSATSQMSIYHDSVWGRSLLPGSGRALYKQLILQTFQAGLSWSTILNKEAHFEARFAQWDYATVARWGDEDVAAALADAGIVRNGAKIRAAVANAAAAVRLDSLAPGGFEKFVWQTCGGLPAAERLLMEATRSGTHMRSSERDDYTVADGVHPTVGVVRAVKAFKAEGFRFLGPAAMLSFMQATGLVNHHKGDCSAFAGAESTHAQAAAAFAALPPLALPLPVSKDKKRAAGPATVPDSIPAQQASGGATKRARRK
jgi:DNA-3-methyladenine glycosylase I